MLPDFYQMQHLQPSSSSSCVAGPCSHLPLPRAMWQEAESANYSSPHHEEELLNLSLGQGLATTSPHSSRFIFFAHQVKCFSAKQISDSKSTFLLFFSSHAVQFEE